MLVSKNHFYQKICVASNIKSNDRKTVKIDSSRKSEEPFSLEELHEKFIYLRMVTLQMFPVTKFSFGLCI